MPFIHEDFLLSTKTARKLYHQYAEAEPIFDYHCHLSPRDIAANRRFNNLFEIWLEGDHYKWRAMRTNGVAERFCTGDASPFEKFKAWAATVPHTLRNPLYHWTHLELKRYFGITDLLDEKTADKIWKQAERKTGHAGIDRAGHPEKIQGQGRLHHGRPGGQPGTSPYIRFPGPSGENAAMCAFRPDKALTVNQPASFNRWVEQLAAASNVDINGFSAFVTALEKRHSFFHSQGCRLSDHGLIHCFADFCSEKVAAGIFDKARNGEPVTPQEHGQFASFLMVFFGQLDAKRGWTQAASSRRDAQQQHAAAQTARPGHRL